MLCLFIFTSPANLTFDLAWQCQVLLRHNYVYLCIGDLKRARWQLATIELFFFKSFFQNQ